jgi:uncharacterized SAM-binding protein YcdF (DUF218 family)
MTNMIDLQKIAKYNMKLFSLSLLFFLFLIYSFLNLGNFLDITQKPTKTDILICLGGGISKNRAEKTIELYKNGYLKTNYIIFTGTPSLNKNITKSFDENINIITNGKVKNTMEEILYIKEFIKEKNLKSVTFITEAPHSRRIQIFWENFGDKLDDVSFSVVASQFDDWDSNTYYKNENSLKYAFSETTKLIYNLFLYGILEKLGFKEEFESNYKKELREMKKEISLTLK